VGEKHEWQSKMYKATTSFSHILGNLTAIIEHYIKDAMPSPSFFKETYVTTEVAFKNIRGQNKNMIQRETPTLIIDPKYLPDDESSALPKIQWDKFIPIDHMNDPVFNHMNAEFFLTDGDPPDYALGYTIARESFAFRIVMLTETNMLGTNLLKYLRANLRFRHMFGIERYTETLIPKAFIDYLAERLGMDQSTPEFLAELNRMSTATIVRLHRPATGKTEFFVLAKSTLQLHLPDLPTLDRTRSQRIDHLTQLEFQIRVEVNVMENFLLVTKDILPGNPTDMLNSYTVRIYLESKAPVIETVRNGYSLYTSVKVEYDKPKETLGLMDFIGVDVRDAIKYINDNGLTEPYSQIVIYEWEELVPENPDVYEFKGDTYELTMKQAKPQSVYTVCVYLNMPYIMEIQKLINERDLNSKGKDYDK
jgi:hypothetical protein